MSQIPAKAMRIIVDVFNAGTEAGELAADNPPLSARAVFSLIHSLSRWYRPGSEKPAVAYANEFFDILAKGILPASPELARDYMVLGQKAYYADDTATAIEMYKKAAPMAADGEAALNLARLYAEAGRDAEAKAAAQQALEKGVKDTAGAKKLAGGK